MNATFYARTSTSNRENRAEHRLLEHLKERLGPEALENGQMPTWSALRQASLAMSVECDAEDQSQIERLTKIIENKANQYLNKPNKKPLDIKRCELLAQCLAYGQNTSYGTGLYTLTAPTGSGKTISSIAFALKHAHTNNLHVNWKRSRMWGANPTAEVWITLHGKRHGYGTGHASRTPLGCVD